MKANKVMPCPRCVFPNHFTRICEREYLIPKGHVQDSGCAYEPTVPSQLIPSTTMNASPSTKGYERKNRYTFHCCNPFLCYNPAVATHRMTSTPAAFSATLRSRGSVPLPTPKK